MLLTKEKLKKIIQTVVYVFDSKIEIVVLVICYS